jgi:hypothetical protein
VRFELLTAVSMKIGGECSRLQYAARQLKLEESKRNVLLVYITQQQHIIIRSVVIVIVVVVVINIIIKIP